MPFPPLSNPHVGILVPRQGRRKGGFGCGPRSQEMIYWFDVFSAYLGCGNGNGNKDCVVNVSASRYSEDSGEVVAGNATFIIPPCRPNSKCQLTPIEFGEGFRGITDIKFEATVSDKAVTLYVDDLKLRWHDDSCEAGLRRESSRKKRAV